MALTKYELWKKNIAEQLYQQTGFSLSEAENIANNVVEKVKVEGGGGRWIELVDYGEHHTSKYRTLKEFVNVLSNSSFGISKSDVRELQRKFSTISSIEAVNSFCLLQSPDFVIEQVDDFNDEMGPPVDNSEIGLQIQQKSLLARGLAKIKTTISEFFTGMGALSVATNVLRLAAIFMGSFAFVTDNEAVVGFLPLGGMGIDSPCSVQNIEVAHTNQQVKFRAVGSIFLANQVGGADAIKITGKLQGPMRLYWLVMLWLLTLISSGTTEVLNWDDEFINSNASLLQVRDFVNGPPVLGTVDTLNKGKQSLISSKPSYERHITFPVILSHEIILNCYVETFSFEEKVKDDKDIITYDLLLRTYRPPREFIADLEQKLFQLKQPTQTQNAISYAINFAYRTAKQIQESVNIDMHTWKIKNYYDVDILDVGQVMFLKLAGMAA